MVTLRELLIALRGTMSEWLRLRWTDLQFTERRTAFFVVVVLLALSLFMLTARRLLSRKAGRTQLGLPAVVIWNIASWPPLQSPGRMCGMKTPSTP